MPEADFSRLRDALLGLATPQRERGLYGRRYAGAEALNDLFLQAGEAVFVAASTLFVNALRRPTTGGIPRRLFHQQSPERFEAFRREEDSTWAWTVALATDKFVERLGRLRDYGEPLSPAMLRTIYERIGVCALGVYSDLAAGGQDDATLDRVCRVLLAYADAAPRDDAERLSLAVREIPTRQPREARLSSALALPGIEVITEPDAFLAQWYHLQDRG